ncbi:hypothetical protein NCHU2750_15510 [Neorhizobium sp. NCHU2750]|nr:hypothetical protein NCHU2750_15510 [Neorhizobium sp. NCHU2750]
MFQNAKGPEAEAAEPFCMSGETYVLFSRLLRQCRPSCLGSSYLWRLFRHKFRDHFGVAIPLGLLDTCGFTPFLAGKAFGNFLISRDERKIGDFPQSLLPPEPKS